LSFAGTKVKKILNLHIHLILNHMLILNADLLKELISPPDVIEAVEQAMLLYEGDGFYMPPRMHAELEGNVLLLMPSFTRSAFGTKLITVFPGNLDRNEAVIQGVMLLNDPATGAPLALMDAAVLTGYRTGAVSAVGIRYLSDPGVRSLGIIGTGIQAWYQVIMACQVRSFSRILLLDLDRGRAEQLAARLAPELDAEILLAGSSEELVRSSDVVITATTSLHPVITPDKDLLRGKTYVGIGSFKPSMREIPEELFQLVERVYVDSRQATEESGDLIYAIKAGLLDREKIFTLGRLMNQSLKPSSAETSFFKSVGMALFDLLVAERIYGLARRQGAGHEIDLGEKGNP
jgi:ornithine cyclodeaminase/alanine dehydrogenase-like protein (mu-crystallin family)